MVGFFDTFPHQSTQPPDRFGRVRVLIVGNAGTGKTALAQYLATKTTKRPSPTVCCNTFVKLVDFPEQVGPDGSILRSQQYFVEFYDMGGHPRYRQLRKLFYKDISGVLLVHDLSNTRSCTALHRWASEVAEAGSFSAPYSDDFTAKNVGGLPVPALVVGTKADLVLSGSAAPYAAILLPLAGIRAAASRLMASVEGAVRRAVARLPLLHGMRRISSRASMLAGSSAGLQDGIEVSVKMRSHPQLGKLDAFLLNLVERRYYNGSKGFVDSNRRFPAATMDSVGPRAAAHGASALSSTPYAFQQDDDLLDDASAVRIDMV